MPLTNEQLETLKGMDWKGDREGLFYFGGKNHDAFFEELTQLHIMCLRDLFGSGDTMESVYWEIAYRFHKGDVFNYYDLHYVIWCKGDVIKDGVIAEYYTDILGLFTEKPSTDWKSFLSDALKKALEETDVDSIVDFIDNNFADVSNKIRENLCDNLEVDDIGETLKVDIARDWIEQNPDDAYDTAIDNMDSYDIKDRIIGYLSDNL